MTAYQCLEQLEEDLEYARNNPQDESFFGTMVERYKNASSDVQKLLKSALYDRMLEHNPTYMIEKIAAENPHKMVYCNTEQDPFFHV
jgi:hypothetical protein